LIVTFPKVDTTLQSNDKGFLTDDFVNSSPETDFTVPELTTEQIAELEKQIKDLRQNRRILLLSADDSDPSNDDPKYGKDPKNDHLILKPNRLTWAQWQMIRKLEDKMSEEKQGNKFKRKLVKVNGPRRLSKKHVLDVVADKGDYVMPTQSSIERYPVPGRIRINSPLIINSLSEILNLALREPYILVYPFKIRADNVDKIRKHLDKLEGIATRASSTTRFNKPQEADAKSQSETAKGTVLNKTPNLVRPNETYSTIFGA
jgi:DNA-binding transcriptional MerR regulator